MTTAGALGDFRASEFAVASIVALAVLGGSAIALRYSGLDRQADAPEIDKGVGVPVRVVPVLDLDAPLLKLGGKQNPAKLPDRWLRQTPKPRAEQKAFVSTKAGKTEADIPKPDVSVAAAKAKPPPPDAELVKQTEAPVPAPVDAGPPPAVAGPGAADGVKEGTETDPLKARAVDIYRQRIRGWFSSRFHVHGTGLSHEEMSKVRVGASIQLSGSRSVAGYSISPSGNAAFDAAARSMLDGAKGQELPPPPDNYPDIAQSQINITLTCSPTTCD